MRPVFPLLTVIACLLGCATNSYTKFYTPVATNADWKSGFQPYSGKTDFLRSSGNNESDSVAMMRKGYQLLGYSSFEGGGRVGAGELPKQALVVGADVVVSSVEFLGREQRAVPILQYHPGQTSTTTSAGTANANVYTSSGASAYGRATYAGTATTTTPGTYSTQMMPVSIQRHSWNATFWRRAMPPVLGVRCGPLSDALRQQYQRNAGAVVGIVVDDSPAFMANILPGDVIVAIDAAEVTEKTFVDACRKRAGELIEVRLFRGMEEKRIAVKLNPEPQEIRSPEIPQAK